MKILKESGIIFLFFLAFTLCAGEVSAARVESAYIRPAPAAGQKNSGYVHAAPVQEESKFKEFGNKILQLFSGK